MRPRIAYWLSSFEPDMEAVAAEVRSLRHRFPGSVAWGMNPRYAILLSPRRGFCVHPRFHLLFRAATRLLEPAFHLNHIVGSLGEWFYLQGPRRRPTVLTLATSANPVGGDLLQRVDRFVAEDPLSEQRLLQMGIGRDRVRLIYSPVDLNRFRPAAAPTGGFVVLFASSPDRADWLEGRGVLLLLDAAARRPRMRFRLLWRPWGDSVPRIRNEIRRRELRNVDLVVGKVSDMAREYRQAHVCVAPFLDPERCKPAPNSLIESLASGRPVVATRTVGFWPLLDEQGGGLVCESEPDSLTECLDRLERDWTAASARARDLAECNFDAESFLQSYAQLYGELLGKVDHSRAG